MKFLWILICQSTPPFLPDNDQSKENISILHNVMPKWLGKQDFQKPTY